MYAFCGSLDGANDAFSRVTQRNVFSWNILLSGCVQNGHLLGAESVFGQMPQHNLVSWNLVLSGCVKQDRIGDASSLLSSMPEKDVFSWTTYLAALARNGQLQQAEVMFARMPQWNIVTWNALLKAYAENNRPRESATLYQMLLVEGMQPEKVTLTSALDCCDVILGKLVHANIAELGLDKDLQLGTALVNMYGKCGLLQDAICCFEKMAHRDAVSLTAMLTAYAQAGMFDKAKELFQGICHLDLVSWNAMMAACVQNGRYAAATDLFKLMDLEGMQASSVSFVVVLDACASLGRSVEGRVICQSISEDELKSNVILATSLVNMYAKCGHLAEAWDFFLKMKTRSVVTWNAILGAYAQAGDIGQCNELSRRTPSWDVPSWNTMISAFAHSGRGIEALDLFRSMDLEGVQLDRVSLLSILDSFSKLPEFEHTKLVDQAMLPDDEDIVVATSVLNMYGKSGNTKLARDAFDRIKDKTNLVPWNALMAAYGRNGQVTEAVELLQSLLLDGIYPDCVTFTHLLSACSHAGYVQDVACSLFFKSMSADFALQPSQSHYACIVDHLARAGRLKEAKELTTAMPFEPDSWTCTTLLAACGLHGHSSQTNALILSER